MQYLAGLWADALGLFQQGNEFLGKAANYAIVFTLAGVIWHTVATWRISRRVTVYAVNGDSPSPKERIEIGRVPRRLVSRAELNGLIGQYDKDRLNLSRFRFDYKFRKQIEIELPAESYIRVKNGLLRMSSGMKAPRERAEETAEETR